MITAVVCDILARPIWGEYLISGFDFTEVQSDARALACDHGFTCIMWTRRDDGYSGFLSPHGFVLQPYWYTAD